MSGVWVHRDDAGVVSVVSVQTGSPADGILRTGDVITAVAGQPVATQINRRRRRGVARRGRHDRGGELPARGRCAHRDLAAHRGPHRRRDGQGHRLGHDHQGQRVQRRAWRRRWRRSPPTARGRHLSGIVLDLRGNPGGLLDEGVRTASVFLDGGLVVTFTKRGAAPLQLTAAAGGDTGTPLAVLVDGGDGECGRGRDRRVARPQPGCRRRQPHVRQGFGARAEGAQLTARRSSSPSAAI